MFALGYEVGNELTCVLGFLGRTYIKSTKDMMLDATRLVLTFGRGPPFYAKGLDLDPCSRMRAVQDRSVQRELAPVSSCGRLMIEMLMRTFSFVKIFNTMKKWLQKNCLF